MPMRTRINGRPKVARAVSSTLLLFSVLPATALAYQPPSANLVLWLAAEDLGKSEQASSSETMTWRDRSEYVNHVQQSAPNRRPLYVENGINGRPVVRFDGAQFLQRERLSGFQKGDQAFHVFLVMQADASRSPSNPRLLDFRGVGPEDNEPRRGFWIGYQGNGRNRLGITNGDEGEASGSAWDNKPHLVEVTYEGAQRWAHFRDGVTDGRGVYTQRTFQGFRDHVRLAIGQHFGMVPSNTFYRGDLAELLVYNRRLSAQDQAAVGRYLQTKYELETEYQAPLNFETDVRPILAKHCDACHGEKLQEGELDLRTVTSILRGGETGPAAVRGRPEHSAIVQLTAKRQMPPDEASQKPLSSQQVSVLRRWVRQGMAADEKVRELDSADLIDPEDRKYWLFQPLSRSVSPVVAFGETGRAHSPIDAFLLDRLNAHSLSFAQEADRRTLARRLSFDLLGLPPYPALLKSFLIDQRPGAYERFVDRLLASPHFGERWGRAWLDWSGYVDTYGTDNDANTISPLSGKWEYRDYVVRSLNQDKPFTRFLREQLAGDQLSDWRLAKQFDLETRDSLVATAYLLSSADSTFAPELNTPEERHQVLQRTGEIVANQLFGLTLQCAKCHDHKYEALSQLDYYRWESIFAPAFDPGQWVVADKRGVPDVPPTQRAEVDRLNQQLDGKVAELKKRRQELRQGRRDKLLAEKLQQLPEPIREDVRIAVATAADKRNDVQKYLAEKLAPWASIAESEIDKGLVEEEKRALAEVDAQVTGLNSQRKRYSTIQVVRDVPAPSATYVLRRGDHRQPTREVAPGLPAILVPPKPSSTTPETEVWTGRHRRLQLAGRLTNADTIAGAVVVRVLVNRVWQQLLGEGIVATSDNLGVSGSRPTHPELLEWLASEFVQGQWRLKPLIREIVLSRAYRQSSRASDGRRVGGAEASQATDIDPANHLLWRARLRRLDSEEVRDAILATSGALKSTFGGPPLPLQVRPDGKVILDQKKLTSADEVGRRSIYVLSRRNYHLSLLATFDQPVIATNCAQRRPSAVVTQSLTLLNDAFVIEQADRLAERLLDETDMPQSSNDWAPLVQAAFQLAFGRSPEAEETSWSIDLLRAHESRLRQSGVEPGQSRRRALRGFCQMLFNANEFLYVP